MVTADELGRSLRGAAALLNREPDALGRFEISIPAFWRSFGAVALTAPAFVVGLARLRAGLGLPAADGVFGDLSLAALTALGQLAAFGAMPVVMACLGRPLGIAGRYVPFVIITNWLTAFSSWLLALPGVLLLLGWETPALTVLFEVAFAAVVVFVHWHATRDTLGTDRSTSAAVTGLALLLTGGCGFAVQSLAPAFAG